MNTVNLPPDPKIAGKIVDAQASHEASRIEAGILGKFFGGKTGAASNTASFIAYGSFFTLVALFIWGQDSQSLTLKDKSTAVISLISLALGFLFGKHSRI